MAISKEEFDLISRFLHDHSGIHIKEGKEYLVENRLNAILVQHGCKNFIELHTQIQSDQVLRTKVIDAMTTNETLWFRDASFINALSDFIVPMLIEKASKVSRPIRIWSAACSTGQEPYSIAMLLDDSFSRMADRGGVKRPNMEKFFILATDISPTAIHMASQGRYTQLAISRGMRNDFLGRYFVKQDIIYEVLPSIRKMVTFKQFNLKSSFDTLGTFDFILCRNVLIYFSEELKQDIYAKIYKSLVSDGLLVIGASESPRGNTNAFEQVMIGGAALYRPK
ncbi:MAG: protein-glutamate O-methyltransferase CheR [Magnetococcus sp. DMHC-6]